ncbi:MAG: hypothetical protein QM714_08815 [Nocardioides sp.]|uniref:hypothetical protein n=1 Tax=Nocardioides sp. TaxID=35761 RepID=UPI0039E61575
MGIPLAGVHDSRVYWSTGPSTDKDTTLKGFDTITGKEIVSVPAPNHGDLSAVDGDSAFVTPTPTDTVARMLDASSEDWVSGHRVGIRDVEEVTAYRQGVGAIITSSEGWTRLALADGSTGFKLFGDYYGLFNHDGSYAALSEPDNFRVVSVPDGKRVPLRGLPEDHFHQASFEWAATDQLIVQGTAESLRPEVKEEGTGETLDEGAELTADLDPVPFLCTIPDGSCTRIADRVVSTYGESSARGQDVANLPPDYEDEGE